MMRKINFTAPMPASPSAALMGYARRLAGDGKRNFIGGGSVNVIDVNACHNAIGGGNDNQVTNSSFTFIGGGRNNQIQTVSNFSAIGGGEDNVIGGAAQQHSFIGGGHDNAVSGACSAILGGQGNNVTHNFAAAFGNGINSVANGHFHINNLWIAPATYNWFLGIAPGGTFPPGTVYVDTTAGGNILRVQ